MLGGVCRADESPVDSAPAVNAQFAANIRNGGAIGSEQVRVVNLTVGTNEFGFVVPRGLNLRVDVAPGWAIYPASMVMFTATLLAVLLVYIKEETREARKLVYGLVLANAGLEVGASLQGMKISELAL